jgi:hypothetical protein
MLRSYYRPVFIILSLFSHLIKKLNFDVPGFILNRKLHGNQQPGPLLPETEPREVSALSFTAAEPLPGKARVLRHKTEAPMTRHLEFAFLVHVFE